MQLIINAGSSTLKWALFPAADEDEYELSGTFDRFGEACEFSFSDRKETVPVYDHAHAAQFLVEFLAQNAVVQPHEIASVVHRVVHGGETYAKPVYISAQVEQDIESLSMLAPLHNPANLAGIRACRDVLPNAMHIAVFDTAFHHTIGREAFMYGIPLVLYQEFRIRKYGFHGISHSYIASRLAELFGQEVDAISCHLGSGSSITALRGGLSVDTTMGFTPLDGVLMGTRSGEIDPEIPLFLMRQGHLRLEEVENMLNTQSGLRGLTGHSDLRDVWFAAQKGSDADKLAIEMLAYRIAYYINAMKTASPNPAAIVFTGGIGEKAWYIREKVCAYLRIPLDVQANKDNAEVISLDAAPVHVLIIPTDEQLQMHFLAQELLSTTDLNS